MQATAVAKATGPTSASGFYLFWALMKSSSESPAVELAWREAEIDIPLASFTAHVPHLRLQRREQASITLKLPYLVNLDAVAIGDRVFAKAPP